MSDEGAWPRLRRRVVDMLTPSAPAHVAPRPPGRIISEKIFTVPVEFADKFEHARKAMRPPDDIERELDAFLLDPGLGPATYLTRDGRVVWEDDWGPIDPGPHNAYATLAVGAKKTGVQELLALLPSRTTDAIDCAPCHGSGWFDHDGQLRDVHGEPGAVVCPTCGGLGWRRGVTHGVGRHEDFQAGLGRAQLREMTSG